MTELNRTPGGLYTGPLAGEPLWRGVDVSQFQRPGEIDWNAAREDGIRWAMVRANYGLDPDVWVQTHLDAIRDADILPGIYLFPTDSPSHLQRQAMSDALDAADLQPGEIAPALDLEWLNAAGRLPSPQPEYLAFVESTARQVQELHGQAWIYTSRGYWEVMGWPKDWEDWDLWRCEWGKDEPPMLPFSKPWSAWQTGAIRPKWAGGRLIDHNLARFLPLVQL